MASTTISTTTDDGMTKPTYRHAPPSNRIVDRRQYKKMYPATTAPKHSEEDKDLDDIDVIYEDTELHLLCQNQKLTFILCQRLKKITIKNLLGFQKMFMKHFL